MPKLDLILLVSGEFLDGHPFRALSRSTEELSPSLVEDGWDGGRDEVVAFVDDDVGDELLSNASEGEGGRSWEDGRVVLGGWESCFEVESDVPGFVHGRGGWGGGVGGGGRRDGGMDDGREDIGAKAWWSGGDVEGLEKGFDIGVGDVPERAEEKETRGKWRKGGRW